MGRKRHLLVDTLGLILHLVVNSADEQDRDGARRVLDILRECFRSLRCIFADSGYSGALANWLRHLLPRRDMRLYIIKRSDAHRHRFHVLPEC